MPVGTALSTIIPAVAQQPPGDATFVTCTLPVRVGALVGVLMEYEKMQPLELVVVQLPIVAFSWLVLKKR